MGVFAPVVPATTLSPGEPLFRPFEYPLLGRGGWRSFLDRRAVHTRHEHCHDCRLWSSHRRGLVNPHAATNSGAVARLRPDPALIPATLNFDLSLSRLG